MVDRHLASDNPQYRHPKDDPPPLGTKLLLLTQGSICVVGDWRPEQGAVAWSPLPKISDELRAKLVADGHMF